MKVGVLRYYESAVIRLVAPRGPSSFLAAHPPDSNSVNPRIIFLLLTIVSPITLSAQSEKIEWEWVREDSASIALMIGIMQERPLDILSMDALPGSEAEDLGFGYSLRETMTSGAYVTTKLQIVLKHGVPVSFAAIPRMPFPYRKLQKNYRKFYAPLFKFDKSGAPLPFYWRMGTVASAIDDSTVFRRLAPRFPLKTPSREQLEFLMSPYSGIDYGCGGRMGSDPYENRQLFNQLRPVMTYRIAVVLLRSINPATRLMALEFMRQAFPKKLELKALSRDVESTLKHFPMVMTRQDGMRRLENARTLLEKFIAENCDPQPITARTEQDSEEED